MEYVDSNRHHLSVSGKVISGWISMASKDGVANMKLAEEKSPEEKNTDEGAGETAEPAAAATEEASPATAVAASLTDAEGDVGKIFTISAKNAVVRSGSNPVDSEKLGSLKAGTLPCPREAALIASRRNHPATLTRPLPLIRYLALTVSPCLQTRTNGYRYAGSSAGDSGD